MSENVNVESSILGISVRAIITFTLVWTVCFMMSNGIDVKEPLYSLVNMAVGFLFGQKTMK